jgi:DNA-binding MarR family transcriptional regulator
VARSGAQAATAETPDPIDWTRERWRASGLGEDENAFLAMGSMMRLHRLMAESIESMLKPLQLNLTDFMLMVTLELNETHTLLISRLARSLLVHATTATLAVDRLEARGLLRRSPHPTDRRAIEVSLTSRGRELVREAKDRLAEVQFGLPGAPLEAQRRLLKVLDQTRQLLGDR